MIRCPNCKSEKILPIVYGLPTLDTFQKAERGELLLGGCVVTFDQPTFCCMDCKRRWSKRSLPFSAIKKVRFKVWQNGLGLLEESKTWVYEIHGDGRAVKYTYHGRNRRYSEKESEYISEKKVESLFRELQRLISGNPKDIVECRICDGCSFQLQVSYLDGEKEIINGELGGGTYDMLMMNLFREVFHENEL